MIFENSSFPNFQHLENQRKTTKCSIQFLNFKSNLILDTFQKIITILRLLWFGKNLKTWFFKNLDVTFADTQALPKNIFNYSPLENITFSIWTITNSFWAYSDGQPNGPKTSKSVMNVTWFRAKSISAKNDRIASGAIQWASGSYTGIIFKTVDIYPKQG